jgi:hypothetical protein
LLHFEAARPGLYGLEMHLARMHRDLLSFQPGGAGTPPDAVPRLSAKSKNYRQALKSSKRKPASCCSKTRRVRPRWCATAC